MSSSAPIRFAGDGLDFRRPVGYRQEQAATPVDMSGEDESTPIDLSGDQEDVIDLTEEDDSGYGPSQHNFGRIDEQHMWDGRVPRIPERARLPRGMHAIIDLDSGIEEWGIEPSPPLAEPGLPDLEFVSSRQISPQRRVRVDSEEDEVEFVREQALPEEERRRRRERDMDRALDIMGDANIRGRFAHLRAHIDQFRAQVVHDAARARGTPPILPPRVRGLVHVGFAPPGLMDFEAVGFNMGMEPAREPAPQAYTAPKKAPAGFTRSPEEEGELVCPNCEEELCIGDGDAKRQVWIVKGCGHVRSLIHLISCDANIKKVYCGECTANRSIKKSSKGKEKPSRTKPFKECVVEDCDKKVTNSRSMFQIFL